MIQLSTNVQEWSWNTCSELYKRLSVWKYDSLKRNFILVHKTLDHIDDFLETRLIYTKGLYLQMPSNEVRPVFFTCWFLCIWVAYVSALGSDHINCIVTSEDVLLCAPVGLESGPWDPCRVRRFRRLAWFLALKSECYMFYLVKIFILCILNFRESENHSLVFPYKYIKYACLLLSVNFWWYNCITEMPKCLREVLSKAPFSSSVMVSRLQSSLYHSS